MDKSTILEKSRNEKNDEGMNYAESRGRMWGVSAFCAVFVLIVLINFFNGQQNYAVFSMFWAFMAAEALPKYRFTKNKSYLITTIAGAIASAASFVSFFMATIR